MKLKLERYRRSGVNIHALLSLKDDADNALFSRTCNVVSGHSQVRFLKDISQRFPELRNGAVEKIRADLDMIANQLLDGTLQAPEKASESDAKTNGFVVDDGGRETFQAPVLAKEIMIDYRFATLNDTEVILRYEDGVYKPCEWFVKEEAQRRLGDESGRERVGETLAFIRQATYVSRSAFNANLDLVNVRNGLLNIHTRQLEPHDPDHLSTMRLPITFDPSARCPNTLKFYSEVVVPQCVPLLIQVVANCLQRRHHYQKATLCVGTGQNGKSTWLQQIIAFLGRLNCAAESLYNLQHARFSLAELDGKLANVVAEIPHRVMKHADIFKQCTGGDFMTAERKNQQPFRFVNVSKFIFASNRPPTIENEDQRAFWRRIMLIDFPNVFEGACEDKNLLGRITSEEELSGLLNEALGALPQLETGGFGYEATWEETEAKYRRLSDPLVAFIDACCTLDSNLWTSTEGLYSAFAEYFKKNQLATMSKEEFGRKMRGLPGVSPQRRGPKGAQDYGYHGIGLNDGTDSKDEKPLF
jgi:putative DNA primase/helicase